MREGGGGAPGVRQSGPAADRRPMPRHSGTGGQRSGGQLLTLECMRADRSRHKLTYIHERARRSRKQLNTHQHQKSPESPPDTQTHSVAPEDEDSAPPALLHPSHLHKRRSTEKKKKSKTLLPCFLSSNFEQTVGGNIVHFKCKVADKQLMYVKMFFSELPRYRSARHQQRPSCLLPGDLESDLRSLTTEGEREKKKKIFRLYKSGESQLRLAGCF